MARNTDSGRGSRPHKKSFDKRKDQGSRSRASREGDDRSETRGRRSASDLGFTKRSRGDSAGDPRGKSDREDKRYSKKEGRFGKRDDQHFKKREGRFGKKDDERFEKREGRFSKRDDERFEKKESRFGKRDDQRFDKKEGRFGRRDDQHLEKRGGSFGRKEDKAGTGRFERKGVKSAGNFRKKPSDSTRSFVQSRAASTSRRETTDAKKKPTHQEQGLTRLNKYIANAGVGSRREADDLIKMGLISVNGTTITEMGFKVKEGDVVRYENKILKAERPVYILLNKPKGFITTTDDPQERKTVMNLVAKACKERVYPVGRLDRNTTGLLLLTNDGDLADKLTHPSYNMKKVYKVELNRPLTKNDFQKISEGVQLEEGRVLVDDLAIVSEDKKTVGIELHIGWNRIVRRIFEALEYEVVKLDRVVYAGLDKKDLPRGNWRFLKSEEIVRLKHLS